MLLRDPWILSLTTWVPLALYMVLFSIFSGGIPQNIPIAIVDHDKTSLSRKFIQYYDAPQALSTVSYEDENQAFTDLRRGTVYGVVIIPHNLSKDARKGLAPQITGFVNYQFLLVGKQIYSNLYKAHGHLATGLDFGKNLADPEKSVPLALSSASPFAVQTTAIANISSNYSQFLVSAIIPATWQVIAVMLSVLSLMKLHSAGLLHSLLAKGVSETVTALCPIVLLLFCQGLLFFWMMCGVLDWPMNGSWTLLLSALLLATLVCISAGILFYAISFDGARALSLTAAYTAPGFAFMGITFPVTDMNIWAQMWRNMLPLSHLSEIQVAETNFASSTGQILPSMASLLLLLLIVSSLASIIGKKRVQRLQTEESNI